MNSCRYGMPVPLAECRARCKYMCGAHPRTLPGVSREMYRYTFRWAGIYRVLVPTGSVWVSRAAGLRHDRYHTPTPCTRTHGVSACIVRAWLKKGFFSRTGWISSGGWAWE